MTGRYDARLLARAFPRYRDFDMIAQNEYGAVCRVWSILDGFPVALKVTQAMGNPLLEARFEREYELLQTTRHPRILQVFKDHGRVPVEMPEGSTLMHFFFTMELCSADVGRSLRRLSFGQRLAVINQLFDGICFLHVSGIAHRDIKPINVFLRGDPEQSGINVKIGDFGIAKDARVGSMLATQGVLGTPGYLAPERLVPTDMNAASRAWFPSDQYALGVTVYEILSRGVSPFTFEAGLNYQKAEDLMKVHRDGSRRQLRVPDLPSRSIANVENVLRKMMAPNVTERFRDVHRSYRALLHACALDGITLAG